MKNKSLILFSIACLFSVKAHCQPIGGNGRKHGDGGFNKMISIRNDQNNWLDTEQ